MEEAGHTFYVNVNAENEQVSVLYRRNDGDYGVIEPAIGGDYGSTSGRRPGQGPERGSGRTTVRQASLTRDHQAGAALPAACWGPPAGTGRRPRP